MQHSVPYTIPIQMNTVLIQYPPPLHLLCLFCQRSTRYHWSLVAKIENIAFAAKKQHAFEAKPGCIRASLFNSFWLVLVIKEQLPNTPALVQQLFVQRSVMDISILKKYNL